MTAVTVQRQHDCIAAAATSSSTSSSPPSSSSSSSSQSSSILLSSLRSPFITVVDLILFLDILLLSTIGVTSDVRHDTHGRTSPQKPHRFQARQLEAPVSIAVRTQPREPIQYGSDAFPAPDPKAEKSFVDRVLKWHDRYCGKSRVCTQVEDSKCYLCSPCACDTRCHDFGDCCPEYALKIQIDGSFPRPFTGSDTNVLSCESAEFRKPDIEYQWVTTKETEPIHSVFKYFMVSRCPHTFTNDASQCESNDNTAPVSLIDDSLVVYKNIYCARCHGAFDVVAWNVQLSCDNRKNFSSYHTPKSVATMALSEPDCTVAYVPPPLKEARKCYTDKNMISKCNVTGLWARRDSFLERACHSYITPKRMLNVLYKNVFCFLCNRGDENSGEIELLLTSCQKNPYTRHSALVATLTSLNENKKGTSSYLLDDDVRRNCEGNQVYDDKERTCREVACALGQHLVSGTCQPMFQSARGVGYELYFGLHVEPPIDLRSDSNLPTNFHNAMEIYLSQTLLQGKVKLQDFTLAINKTHPQGHCSPLAYTLGIYTRLVSQSMIEQKALQDLLLGLRRVNFHMSNMSFRAFPSESLWPVLHPSKREYPKTKCGEIVGHPTRRSQIRDGMMKVGTTTPDPLLARHNLEPPYVRMSSLLSCPHVHLLPHEYKVSGMDGVVTLQWNDHVMMPNEYITDLEGNVTICFADFLPKLSASRQKRTVVEKMLAYVLLPISIMCLLLCLLVFTCLSELRSSLMGKNNMVLSVCLLCSQAGLLVGYMTHDYSLLCVIMGAVTHYFTVCFFCAICICSYQAYAFFNTMHLSADESRNCKTFVTYCCFIFFVPLAIVGIVVVLFVSEDAAHISYGYGGGSMCLLSSVLATWLSLFLPLLVSLVIAAVLYAMTRSALSHNKDLETNATDERHVRFYFRTSILTTATWTVGVLGFVLSLSAIRIAFIACQFVLGLYIFGVLVLNLRVIRLLFGWCCGSRRPPRGRTSLNLKMAPRTDCPARNPCIVATKYRMTEHFAGGESDSPPRQPRQPRRVVVNGDYNETRT